MYKYTTVSEKIWIELLTERSIPTDHTLLTRTGFLPQLVIVEECVWDLRAHFL